MPRTGTDVREAERLEKLAHSALVISHAKALQDEPLQVDSAPTDYAMHGPVRAGLNELGDLRPLLPERRGSGPLDLDQLSRSHQGRVS